MIPRFRTEWEGDTIFPSIRRLKFCSLGRSDFGPVIRSSVLLLFSLRKLLSIQVFKSEMQSVMVERIAGVMDLVDM